MIIERAGNHFVISRRVGRQRLYFQFHVNGSKGSWLPTKDHATRYRRIVIAERVIERLTRIERRDQARVGC